MLKKYNSKIKAYLNMYAKFQLHPPSHMASEKKIFECLCFFLFCFFLCVFFFLNRAFRWPWPPIKISDLNTIHIVGRGLFQKHFSKIFVKISAVTQKQMPFPTFPILSTCKWKL